MSLQQRLSIAAGVEPAPEQPATTVLDELQDEPVSEVLRKGITCNI